MNKNITLFAAIITTLVFIGYLTEPGPYPMFGYSINIWFVRLAWLIIAFVNIANYIKLKNTGKKKN